jgi:hypothetical protein
MKSIEEVLKSKRSKMDELARDINTLQNAMDIMEIEESNGLPAGISASSEPRGIPPVAQPVAKRWP